MPQKQATPDTLPADFFSQPETLPADFNFETPKQKQAVTTPSMGFGERAMQTGVGMAKGLGHTALGLGELGQKMMGGSIVNKLQGPEFGKKLKEGTGKIEEKLKPTNPSQKAGYGAEQVLEYATPLGEEKLISKIPSGLQLLSRAALTAGRTGATAAAQAGGDPAAGKGPAAVAGGTSLLFGALGPAISKLGSKIQLSTIKPSSFDVADGFKTETLKGLGLKGNLEQSLQQVESKLGKLKAARNSLIAPGAAKVELSTVFNNAIAAAKTQAGKLKFGPAGKQLIEAMEKMRDDTYELLGIPAGTTGKVAADVRVAENLKEYLGTMGSWAYGGSAADKITEHAANSLYTGVKGGIESSLGPTGDRVRALNAEMQKLIPVKHAMLKRIPVEQRQSLIKLSDLAATLPAVITGDLRHLTIEGLNRAQQSLRFGNWLVRNAGKTGAAASVAGRAAGGADAAAASPRNRLDSPQE